MDRNVRPRAQGFKRAEVSKPADHMSDAEIVLTMLAEVSTRQIAESMEATGFEENAEAAKKGGGVARKTREELEQKSGKSVLTSQNYLPPKNSDY